MNHKKNKVISPVLGYGLLFMVYLAVRLLAWKNTVLLEDHDSVFLLFDIKAFLSWDWRRIIDMRADATPLYPFFSALCRFAGGHLEIAARLCSLVFSSLLFWSVALIGQRIAGRAATLIGLVILSLSPVMIPLSYGVLTEPSYIAVCYLGLWLFLLQLREPRLPQACWLGLVFGLSFLSRTEGILYLVTVPVIQGAAWVLTRPRPYPAGRLARWILVYTLFFAMVAAPQVWRVSRKMGHLAINGRQVWTLILKNPDGKTYEEKIYGLDHSPAQINLYYLQSHPEIIRDFESSVDLKSFVRNSLNEFDILYRKNLGALIGPVGIVFFALGILALYQSGLRLEAMAILAFIASALVAPLVHNVAMRHIAIIAPIMMLVEGIGIVYLSGVLFPRRKANDLRVMALSGLCLVAVIGAFILPLKDVYVDQPKFADGYHPAVIRQIVPVIQQHVRESGGASPNRILAKKAYLPYYAQGEAPSLPYTDYAGLVEYCGLNDIGFLFLEHGPLKDYPFLAAFQEGRAGQDFRMIYQGRDECGKVVELYRFIKN